MTDEEKTLEELAQGDPQALLFGLYILAKSKRSISMNDFVVVAER